MRLWMLDAKPPSLCSASVYRHFGNPLLRSREGRVIMWDVWPQNPRAVLIHDTDTGHSNLE